MYQSHDVIKEKLLIGKSIKKCYTLWFDKFSTEFEYLDESEYYNETPGFSNCSNFDGVKLLVHDAVKTLKLLSKDEYVRNRKALKLLVGKIVSFNIFAGRIDIRKSDMLWLIDFIEWDHRYLSHYAEEWASSEESRGYDMDTLLKLADKHDKKIKGYRNSRAIFGLLMAVGHCSCDLAEQFVIDNNIKLTEDLIDSDDALIDDMIEFFKEERSYNLVGGHLFDS